MNNPTDNRPSALVVLDWPNIVKGLRRRKRQLDPQALYDFFRLNLLDAHLDLCVCLKVIAFDQDWHTYATIMHLRKIGYRVSTHTVSAEKNHADVDALVAMEATWALATNPRLECLVIGSGDGDFIPVFKKALTLKYLQKKRLSTWVLASEDSISSRLKGTVDEIVHIESVPGLTKPLDD